MDNDTANLSEFAIKRVNDIIDLAIVDIFNSKKKTGFIAEPAASSTLLNDVRLKWFNLSNLEKEYLTEQIKHLKTNLVFRPKVSNQDIIMYFAKFVLPYFKSEQPKESKDKRLLEIFAWANEVYAILKTINDAATRKKHYSKLKKKENRETYSEAVSELYRVYGKPSKREQAILKFKLLFKEEYKILKHLLKEQQNWNEITKKNGSKDERSKYI